MPRKDEVAGRIAESVIKRLVTRRLIEIRDERPAREAVRRILADDLAAEDELEGDARALLLSHAKEIRESASDYRRLLTMVKGKLARERGFTL